MKKMKLKWGLLLILSAPLFMYFNCNKEDEENLIEFPNTDEYFTWRIPGNNGNMTDPADSVIHNYYVINKNVLVSYRLDGSENTYVSFDATSGTGTFPAIYFNVFTNGRYFVGTSTPIQVNVTTFGAPGQHIIGNYSGTVKDSTGTQTYSVSGNFKVRNY